MGKSYPAKTSFNGGVQSPLLHGLVDAPRGASAFQASSNMIPLKHGPIVRRGGTEHIVPSNSTGWNGKKSHILPFNYNDEQSYILEFASVNINSVDVGRLRIYKDKGIVLSGSTLDAAGSNYQTITSIENLGPTPFEVRVADTSGFSQGRDVVFSVSSGATELDGKLATISSVVSSTVLDIEFWGLPDYTNGAITGTIREVYEVNIPYSGDDLFESDGTFRLDVRQINDVMYLAHPDYPTQILARTAHDAWTVTEMEFKYGPFEPENLDTNKRLYVTEYEWKTDQNGNQIRVAEINTKVGEDTSTTFDMFSATDCLSTASGGWDHSANGGDGSGVPNGGTGTKSNRQLKLFVTNQGADFGYRWRYVTIIKYISPSKVWITPAAGPFGWNTSGGSTLPGTTASNPVNQWALGAFSDTTGYPSAIEIHAGRLSLAGTSSQPRLIHMSAMGAFSTTDSEWDTVDIDGQVYDDHGLSLTIGGGNSAPIKWLTSLQSGLGVGTSNEEGLIRPSDETKGFVPGNAVYSSDTTVGSKSVQPIRIDQSTLFISKTGRRVHELGYDLSSGGQTSPDLTALAEHVTKTGIIDFAWQREPIDTLWCVLADGKLIALTFDKNEDILAWHQHELGGDNNASNPENFISGRDYMVRSVAVIPSVDGLSEDLWLVVDRHNKAGLPGLKTALVDRVTGSIEVLSPHFSDSDNIKDAKHFDSYLTYTPTILSKTVSSDGTVGGLSNDSIYYVSNVSPSTGYTDNPDDNYFLVQSGKLSSLSGGAMNFGQSFTADIQLTSTTFSDMELFAGKTISIYADGRALDSQLVYSGSNTLSGGKYAANLTVGYPYTSYVELKNLEGGGIQNLMQGKQKIIRRLFVRLLNSLGLKFGDSSTNLDEYEFDEDKELSEFRGLKSGDYIIDWNGEYEKSGTVRLQGDGPYPLQIQLVAAEMDTQGYSSNR